MIPHIHMDGLADSAERSRRSSVLMLAAVMLGAILGLFQCGNIAEAQEPDTALVLAQACWGETAVTAHDECTAIAQVLARRSTTGTVTPSIARAYSSALRGHSRHVRPWLLELDASGERPASWPERLSWTVWRPRWLALLAHAEMILEGSPGPSGCSAPPDHWGGAMDSPRALRAGWVAVDCGRTRNRFWRVSRR